MDSLPPELLTAIFHQVAACDSTPATLLSLAQINHTLHSIFQANQQSILASHIAANLNGVETLFALICSALPSKTFSRNDVTDFEVLRAAERVGLAELRDETWATVESYFLRADVKHSEDEPIGIRYVIEHGEQTDSKAMFRSLSPRMLSLPELYFVLRTHRTVLSITRTLAKAILPTDYISRSSRESRALAHRLTPAFFYADTILMHWTLSGYDKELEQLSPFYFPLSRQNFTDSFDILAQYKPFDDLWRGLLLVWKQILVSLEPNAGPIIEFAAKVRRWLGLRDLERCVRAREPWELDEAVETVLRMPVTEPLD